MPFSGCLFKGQIYFLEIHVKQPYFLLSSERFSVVFFAHPVIHHLLTVF